MNKIKTVNTKMNIMRYLRIVFYLMLSSVFYACESHKYEIKEIEEYQAEYGVQTIKHEGCEYVLYKDRGNWNIQMMHKHNCKYCINNVR